MEEDYRFIEIEEELEDDDEEEEEFDHEENLIPEDINLPVNLDLIDELENEDDEDDDDYEDEDEDDDYEDYEDDDDDYEDYEEFEQLVEMTSPRVSSSISDGRNLNQFEVSGDVRKEEINRSEIDGLICPICLEAWTSGGQHQICCLPCGHIYGLYCINKWLQQRRSSGKCPQCNNLCTLKDVRVLYVNGLCVADEELHKRVRLLEAKCAYLEQKVTPLTPEELIDQICRSPTLVQRLATALTELHQQQVSP